MDYGVEFLRALGHWKTGEFLSLRVLLQLRQAHWMITLGSTAPMYEELCIYLRKEA